MLKKQITALLNKNGYTAVIGAWLFFELIWILVFGFNFQEESLKYIQEADFFAKNLFFSQQRYIFYSSTIFIIVFSNAIKIGVYGAVCFVMLLNLISYLYFFKALKKKFSSPVPIFAIIIFLLLFWPYQRWSITLYSEGIYYSLVLLLFSLLIQTGKITAKFTLSLLTIIALLLLTRPMGILFVIPVLLFVYQFLSKHNKIIFIISGVVVLLLFNFVVQIVFTTTKDWSMAQALQSDIIIADKDEIPVNKNLIVTNNENQLYQLFFYLTHNFGHFCYLAIKRLQAFFFLTRNYFSFGHNIFLLTPVLFIYGIVVVRFRKIKTVLGTPLFLFIFSSIFFYATAVALQFDDYHNRFFLTLMPFWVLMAVAGFFKKSITEK